MCYYSSCPSSEVKDQQELQQTDVGEENNYDTEERTDGGGDLHGGDREEGRENEEHDTAVQEDTTDEAADGLDNGSDLHSGDREEGREHEEHDTAVQELHARNGSDVHGGEREEGQENEEQAQVATTDDKAEEVIQVDGTRMHEDEGRYEENGQDVRSQHDVDAMHKDDNGDKEEKTSRKTKGRTAFVSIMRKPPKRRKRKKRLKFEQIAADSTDWTTNSPPKESTTATSEATKPTPEAHTAATTEESSTTTETSEENSTASPACYSQGSLSAATGLSASIILLVIGGLLCWGDCQIKRPRQVAGDSGEDGRPDQERIELNNLAADVSRERLHAAAAADLVDGAGDDEEQEGAAAEGAAGEAAAEGAAGEPAGEHSHRVHRGKLSRPTQRSDGKQELKRAYASNALLLPEETAEEFNQRRNEYLRRLIRLNEDRIKMDAIEAFTRASRQRAIQAAELWFENEKTTRSFPSPSPPGTHMCNPSYSTSSPLSGAFVFPPATVPTRATGTTNTGTTLASPNTIAAASSLASFLAYRRQQRQEEKREAHAAMQGWDVIEEVTERDESSISTLNTPATSSTPVPSATSSDKGDKVVAVVHNAEEDRQIEADVAADVEEGDPRAASAASRTTQTDATRQTGTAGAAAGTEALKEAADLVQEEQQRFLSLSDPELYGTIDKVCAERQIKSDEGLKRKSRSRFMILRKKLVPQKLFKSATEKEKEQKTQAMVKRWFRSLLGQKEEPVAETPSDRPLAAPVDPPRRSSSRATLRRRPWISTRSIAPVPWTPIATPISALSEPCLPMSPLESLQYHYRRGTFGTAAGASPSSAPPKESRRLSAQELRNLRKLAAQIAKDGAAAHTARPPVRPIRLVPPPIPPRRRSFSDTGIGYGIASSGTPAVIPETAVAAVKAGTGRRTKSAT